MRTWASLVAQRLKHLPGMRETWVIPGLGRSPGERNGNPLQHSCLENPMEGGAWDENENLFYSTGNST